MNYRSLTELEASLDHILQSPKESGTVELIVRRPAENEREVLAEGVLDLEQGLVGDTWKQRPSGKTGDGSAHPDMQLNIMNARVVELVAVERGRWPLAGDQFYVDLDLSVENLPPGTRLEMGSAIVEVTAEPHRGCAKFKARFGADALQFVNSTLGKEHNFRGINAKVVRPGIVRQGDSVRRL